MPNICIKMPKGAFPGEARSSLVRHVLAAAATAEQMSTDPKSLALTWIAIEEVETGMWTSGAVDISAQVLTCLVLIHVPAGVLDDGSRAQYVKLVHEAFRQAMPPAEKRRLATSVILQDVADGSWGGNGAILTLATFAKAAGYAHLKHLTTTG